jgi:hypothetical protein
LSFSPQGARDERQAPVLRKGHLVALQSRSDDVRRE